MNRRPWPIVILALIQILSPIIGLWGAAIFYGVSLFTLAEENWRFSSNWQKVETYLIPVIVGLLIYFTRRIGYYLALLGCGYLIYRNLMEYVISEREAPVWVTVVANLFVFAMIVYLNLPKVRAVYMNPALRWWENAPRFVLSWPVKLRRLGDDANDAQLHDISIGGAAISCANGRWLAEEELLVEFDHDAVPVKLKGRMVYRKETSPGMFRLGLKWTESNANSERSKLRRLIRTLDTGGVPLSRRLPYWWDDLKDWIAEACSSREAWLPKKGKRGGADSPDRR